MSPEPIRASRVWLAVSAQSAKDRVRVFVCRANAYPDEIEVIGGDSADDVVLADDAVLGTADQPADASGSA